MGFETKDSGERLVFDSGMQRDVTTGKVDYLLVRDGPMFQRWAELLARGAEKYDKRNWMRASGWAEWERFRESAARHFEQWLAGDTDEDHAAAVLFNINGAEYVLSQLEDLVYSDEEECGCCEPPTVTETDNVIPLPFDPEPVFTLTTEEGDVFEFVPECPCANCTCDLDDTCDRCTCAD